MNNGIVLAIAIDSQDRVYIGGSFTGATEWQRQYHVYLGGVFLTMSDNSVVLNRISIEQVWMTHVVR